MPLVASNRFINVSAVGFTPTGGTLTAIKGVQNATIQQTATDVSEGGDGDLYNTVGGVVFVDPMVSLEFMNAMALTALAPGAYGTLTFTLNDSANKALTGGGAVIFTIINCYLMPQQIAAQHRQVAKATMNFKTFSVDGQTNPVSTAAA